jgi:hypothetical protein
MFLIRRIIAAVPAKAVPALLNSLPYLLLVNPINLQPCLYGEQAI